MAVAGNHEEGPSGRSVSPRAQASFLVTPAIETSSSKESVKVNMATKVVGPVAAVPSDIETKADGHSQQE